MEEYYSHWEWQPSEYMPDGCSEVLLRSDTEIREMCSCDYWWLSPEEKEKYCDFRYA